MYLGGIHTPATSAELELFQDVAFRHERTVSRLLGYGGAGGALVTYKTNLNLNAGSRLRAIFMCNICVIDAVYFILKMYD